MSGNPIKVTLSLLRSHKARVEARQRETDLQQWGVLLGGLQAGQDERQGEVHQIQRVADQGDMDRQYLDLADLNVVIIGNKLIIGV